MEKDRDIAIPDYWDRFKRSPRVRKMKDYQRYWYKALCNESHLTDRPGYLPNDMHLLYELADCSASEKFFQQNFACVRECFQSTDDGRWLFNERALEIAVGVQEKSDKAKHARSFVGRTLDIGISTSPSLSIYQDFKPKISRNTALKAIEKAIKRVSKEEKISDIDAAEKIHRAVIEWSKSDACKPNGLFDKYTPPYPATWFNAERYLDDPKEWRRKDGGESLTAICARVAGDDDF